MDSVDATLDELTAALEAARAVPMSGSCVVNRSDLLALVADLRSRLPAELGQARRLLADRDALLAAASEDAQRIVAAAHEERARLLDESDLRAQAQAEAEQLLVEADATAAAMRSEVNEYVDGKLANFEVVLAKTLKAVERGRAKLAGRDELAEIVDQRDEAGSPG